MIPSSYNYCDALQPRFLPHTMLALAVLSVCYILNMIIGWSGYSRSDIDWLDSRETYHLHVAGNAFAVPANLLRVSVPWLPIRPVLERDASLLQLAVIWPDMNARAPQDIAAGKSEPNLVLIDLEPYDGQETLRERLDPVYRRLARAPETAGPAGLRILTLSAAGSEIEDQIMFEPGRGAGFVARCTRQEFSDQATCTRKVALADGLFLTYRFTRQNLANWGRLDRKVIELVNRLKTS